MPDTIVAEVVGGSIFEASKGGTRSVRAFGEMVAVLCERGNHAAAIRIEELWNDLSTAAALEAEVDKRTQAEQTLRTREKELAEFLDNAAEGLNRVSPDGKLMWANRAELELLGFTHDEYVGSPWAGFHVDADRGQSIVDRMRAGEVLYNEAASLRCKDGSVRHVLIHTTPVHDRGELQCTRCFTRDVTEQHEAREVLEKAHDERTRLLRELASANQAKDEFLAMLGHELRNPLAPIVTSLQLMKMRGDGDTVNEQAIIQRQVDHLIRLVDDLLDVSKITRGKVELRKESVEIRGVLAKAVEMASPLFEQRRHRLIVHSPTAPMPWVGDPVRLAQVVSNLLTNAARYTPPGGEVVLTAMRDTSDVVISVRDNGMGIAPHMLSRVFDLFVQGERGVDRAEGGLGIGLALVKSLVSLHGGTVLARSEGPGRGSEFVVRLPLSNAGATKAPASRPKAPAVARESIKRVLVVDDNADAADMLGVALRAQGHEVRVVHDPAAALTALDSFRPDVAVLDIGLPVMDGYELATRLRTKLREAPCRFVALTGYGQEGDRQRSKDAGFERHLVKPVDIDQLIEVVAVDMPQAAEGATN